MPLLAQLAALPDGWALVAVGGDKRPYQPRWQHTPITKDQAAAEIRAGRAKAIGVLCGPPSGGLLFLDHDGISATAVLERLGTPCRDLPPTVAVTSGRDGRFQLIYRIPEQYWPNLAGRRVFRSDKADSDGKAEQLELRWAGHQSVVIGAHPTTSGYRWLDGRGPADVPIAEAPIALIELLLDQPATPQLPLLERAPLPIASATTVPFLDFITRDSRDLITSGGTPGAWNDDQLRLALDLQGTEAWIRANGVAPDISARDAFADHIHAARSKARDFDTSKAWARFDGAEGRNPTPGTPEGKLRSRLAFHARAQLPPRAPAPAASVPQQRRAVQPGPPIKIEAGELLAMLRDRAADGAIRWNTFTQQIEIDGAQFDAADRFYLHLAEQGFKVTKALALDALVQVAKENPYDPVTLYLDHVAATISPTHIGTLSTAYLRPDDFTPSGEPTLYDHMIRCTLIGAVRRAFEPGSKHDTACVLAGDQGGRKSSFWEVLGGPFFSNALGDCSTKDDLMVLHRSWIMEWSELDRVMGRKHAGQVKAFLSQATDMFRVPYGATTEAHPRRGIICGTTNRSNGFLQDETGNRRFWVIPTTRTEIDPIDTPTLAVERDAIWSAAVHAYRAGEPSHLPPDLARQVAIENETYQVANPWLPVIESWLATHPGDVITTEGLLSDAIEKPTERQTKIDQMVVADALKALGYERRRVMENGDRRWRWGKVP